MPPQRWLIFLRLLKGGLLFVFLCLLKGGFPALRLLKGGNLLISAGHLRCCQQLRAPCSSNDQVTKSGSQKLHCAGLEGTTTGTKSTTTPLQRYTTRLPEGFLLYSNAQYDAIFALLHNGFIETK
jgi:hypothetical protein